jgi:hypothetical protein
MNIRVNHMGRYGVCCGRLALEDSFHGALSFMIVFSIVIA